MFCLFVQTRLEFKSSFISMILPFERLRVDIWGGYHVSSLLGAHYFLTIVDDYTICTRLYLIRHESET